MGKQASNPFLASLNIARSTPVRSVRAPNNTKANPVSEAEKKSIYEDAMSGLYTRQQIADRHGRMTSTIKRWIPKDHNIVAPSNRRMMDIENKVKTMRLLRSGLEPKEVAQIMDATPPTIYRVEQTYSARMDRRFKQIIRRMCNGEIYHMYLHSPRITHSEIEHLHDLGYRVGRAKVDESTTVFCPPDQIENWKDRYYGTEKQWRKKG